MPLTIARPPKEELEQTIESVHFAVFRSVTNVKRLGNLQMVFRQDGTWYVTEVDAPILLNTLDIITQKALVILMPVSSSRLISHINLNQPLDISYSTGKVQLLRRFNDAVLFESDRAYSLTADSLLYQIF